MKGGGAVSRAPSPPRRKERSSDVKLTRTIRTAYIAIALSAVACVLFSGCSPRRTGKAGARPYKIETKVVNFHSEFSEPAHALWNEEVSKHPELKGNLSRENEFEKQVILKKLNEKYGPEGWLFRGERVAGVYWVFYRIVEETHGGKTVPLFRVQYAYRDDSVGRIYSAEEERLLKKLGLDRIYDLPRDKRIETEIELWNLAYERFTKDCWIRVEPGSTLFFRLLPR